MKFLRFAIVALRGKNVGKTILCRQAVVMVGPYRALQNVQRLAVKPLCLGRTSLRGDCSSKRRHRAGSIGMFWSKDTRFRLERFPIECLRFSVAALFFDQICEVVHRGQLPRMS